MLSKKSFLAGKARGFYFLGGAHPLFFFFQVFPPGIKIESLRGVLWEFFWRGGGTQTTAGKTETVGGGRGGKGGPPGVGTDGFSTTRGNSMITSK